MCPSIPRVLASHLSLSLSIYLYPYLYINIYLSISLYLSLSLSISLSLSLALSLLRSLAPSLPPSSHTCGAEAAQISRCCSACTWRCGLSDMLTEGLFGAGMLDMRGASHAALFYPRAGHGKKGRFREGSFQWKES